MCMQRRSPRSRSRLVCTSTTSRPSCRCETACPSSRTSPPSWAAPADASRVATRAAGHLLATAKAPAPGLDTREEKRLSHTGSTVGSIRSANDLCASPSSRVKGTTSILGYASGNNSWSSTTTAGRSLPGSWGKEPPRQSTTTMLPAEGPLTGDRSAGSRAHRARFAPQGAQPDGPPPDPRPPEWPLAAPVVPQPQRSPERTRSAPCLGYGPLPRVPRDHPRSIGSSAF